MQLLAHRPADFTDRLICFWTRGLFSHVAVLCSGRIYEAVPGAGVRCVDVVDYFAAHSIGQYEIFDIPGADGAAAEKFARSQLGKPYDWRSIIGFATLDRATRERAGYWQCAEFAYVMCAKAGVWLFAPDRTNPADLSPSLLPLSSQLSLAA